VKRVAVTAIGAWLVAVYLVNYGQTGPGLRTVGRGGSATVVQSRMDRPAEELLGVA
jgi:hypothetical protein